MKLKYQMRGLGIGMAVTALVMGAAAKEGLPLSDAEIRARAAELGMVDGRSLSLKDVQGAVPEPTMLPTSAPEEVSGNEGKPEERQEETAGSDRIEPAESDENDPSVEAGGEAEPTEEPDDKVTVVIESGVSSAAVSRLLAQAGLIEDAGEFDSYLCGNGYSVRIHAGTYEISRGATEEEIMRIITKSR